MAFPVRDPQGSGFKSDMRDLFLPCVGAFCAFWFSEFAHFAYQENKWLRSFSIVNVMRLMQCIIILSEV